MSAKKRPTLEDAVSEDLNYEIWAPITRTTLLEKGLWDVVENGVPPDPSKIPEMAAKVQPQEVSKWRDLVVKDMKALQVLQSSLPDSVFRKTLETTSSKDLWDSLEEANEGAKLQKKFEAVSNHNREDALPEYQMLAITMGSVAFDEDMWMVYNTTTNHMTPYVKYFTTLDRTYRAKVRFMNGNTTMAEGIGDVRIRIKEGIKTIKNVLLVPGINRNVLSLPQFATTVKMNLAINKFTILDRETGKVYDDCLWDEKRCFYLRSLD